MDDKIREAHAVIDEARRRYHTDQVYAAFSGGHDSLAATALASLHPSFKGVVHINTTIGVPETRQFVIDTCENREWPLHIGRTAKMWGYVQLVLRFGFPGPSQHQMIYQSLKNKPLSKICTSLRERPGQNIIICTGIRRNESKKRMKLSEQIRKEGNIIWVSHMWDWTAQDCSDFMREMGLKRNPVKDKLHISGECLCGCFADKDERREIKMWFPHVDEEITKIESLVQTASDLELQDYDYRPRELTWGWCNGNFERAIQEAKGQGQTTQEMWSPGAMCSNCMAGRQLVPEDFQDAETQEAA